MTVIFAIDPGSSLSAWLVYDATTARVRSFARVPNDELLGQLHLGIGIGGGRFTEAAARSSQVERLERIEVKKHLLGTPKGTDAQVRATLIDRFGGIGGKAAAVGRKASPGPLYGIANDVWQALAVAVAYSEGAR